VNILSRKGKAASVPARIWRLAGNKNSGGELLLGSALAQSRGKGMNNWEKVLEKEGNSLSSEPLNTPKGQESRFLKGRRLHKLCFT